MTDEQLEANLTRVLHRVADGVTVDDRLDAILGGTLSEVGLIGTTGRAGRPGHPGRWADRGVRPPAGRRLLAVAAAAVLVAALAAVAWRTVESTRTVPAVSTTVAAAGRYPVFGDAEAGPPTHSSEMQSTPKSVLVLGRTVGTSVTDLVTITVASPPSPPSTAGPAAGPAAPPTGPASPAVTPETVRIGDRLVTRQSGLSSRGFDVIVWLAPDVTPDQRLAVTRLLDANLGVVHNYLFVDQAATYAEFRSYYTDQPEVLELVQPSQLPTSFRINLRASSGDGGPALAAELRSLPGVQGIDPSGEEAELLAGTARYQWEEAGAVVTVAGPREEAEAVIPALSVAPGSGLPQPRVVRPTAGLRVLAGPSRTTGEPQPTLWREVGSTQVHLTVLDHPDFPLTARLGLVTIGGATGFTHTGLDGMTVIVWPAGHSWVQLQSWGLTVDQARAVAESVTFTDRSSWLARYPGEEPGVNVTPTTTEPTPSTPTG